MDNHREPDKINMQLTANRLKELRRLHQKKYRQQNGLILVEGKRLLDQLHNNGITIEELFCVNETYRELSYLKPNKITFCQSWQLQKLSQTRTSQDVIGLVKADREPITKVDFLLYLDQVSEPGNLGAIFRTALGLGINGIITSPNCCDLFNPKTIRASLGAVFSCPTIERDHLWLSQQSTQIVVSSLDNAKDLNDIGKLEPPVILVIGSEAHGVSNDILKLAEIRVKIPMSMNMESLNAAVAAGILMYKLKSHVF